MEREFRFYRNAKKEWYVDLPEWAGNPGELQMVEGADTWLDRVAGDQDVCLLKMADVVLPGAETLTLIRARDPQLKGGGDYLLETYKGNVINQTLWLCVVTEFVFGQLPKIIWFKTADDH